MRLALAPFLLLALAPDPARAFGGCMDDSYLSDAFIVGTPPQQCHVTGPFPVVTARGTSQLRLLQPTSTLSGPDPALHGCTEQLAVALGPPSTPSAPPSPRARSLSS